MYNPTEEMKRLLDIVKQQATTSDIKTHIDQIGVLVSAVKGQLAALQTKQNPTTTAGTTRVLKQRLQPKGKPVARITPKPPKPKPIQKPIQQQKKTNVEPLKPTPVDAYAVKPQLDINKGKYGVGYSKGPFGANSTIDKQGNSYWHQVRDRN
tara:strand:- start:249 stop:704 length:456 start_codon:yes stop_codon:yes gene_type:complete